MKPKNVMLLGFVNKAVEYLDRHLDDKTPDAKLMELKNIDFQSIKSELSENLDLSLGTMQSTMSALLDAGNDAFDKFLERHVDRNDVHLELDKIFNTYYDDVKLNSQEELSKLISFYNLDDDFDIDDIDLPEQPAIKEIDSNDQEDEYMKQIRENANRNNLNKPIEPINVEPSDSKEIDDILSEILAVRKEKPAKKKDTLEKFKNNLSKKEIEVETAKPAEEVKAENKGNVVEIEKQEKKQSYVSSLFNDLRKQLYADDEAAQQREMVNSDVYTKIHNAFPSLSVSFVRSVYDLKDSFASENPDKDSIILLHRLHFKTVEDLRSFVEIVLNHEYNINADEKKMIVDTFKQIANADGKIMTNIFEVANQANVLNATYEGYRII